MFTENIRRSLVTVAMLAGFGLLAACGTESSADSTAVAASATAERRQQAIATFTAEAAAAGPTATRFPTSVPTSNAAQATQSFATAAARLTPLPSPTPGEGEQADRAALEELLRVRSEAMSAGDIDAWYETCSPTVRESARDSNALEKQLAALQIDPAEGNVSFEFVLEQAFLTGGTSATVVWGWRAGPNYFPGVGGGPYVKEDGQWYSIGWGCSA